MKLKDKVINLSGDDHRIVKHCEEASQSVFFITGLFIPVIFVICLASSFITFYQVFHNAMIGVSLSLFFAWMITNLYRLMLYTFTRNPLPQVTDKMGKLFSRALRLCFVCFIAVMIAKPIESVLYKDLLDLDIAMYKIQAKKNSHYNIAFYYQKQIDEVMKLSGDPGYTLAFLQGKQLSRGKAILRANVLIDSSGFFLQRIRFLCTKHHSCWWITAFFLLVFLYPVVLKYHVRNCRYYELKGFSDQRKIDLNYYVCRKKCAALFEKLYSRRVTYSERFEDPPYNTIPKEDRRRFLTENEFISELYNV